MTLIPADELKKTYEVSAKFYYSEVNGERFLMRREAKIVRIGHEQEEIDAVVVMINPGSCKPTGAVTSSSAKEAILMAAKPDQTQYQLMNLMERKAWNVLVIVNLSDICEGNMSNFRNIERKFQEASLPHSIFQDENMRDCHALLSSAKHVIFAWGESTTAKRLSEQFGLFKNGRATIDYGHMKAWVHSERGFPRHPRPALTESRIIWLDTMETLL
ncbi:hypothetical protein QOZ98_001358 [Planomicrobium stackebrandtii]|uniref:DUF1643 domain-containing protein n=1 Tax=Planomicrobium stackebrandtii TaxID=253160 RepID=A0ABU0GT49_9BACL|nr:DUF1643 domain-containing protein [Planomicrobium stackebrandtii]MDQ0428532.1 hypothetical protein [Planomicrobium stackebrandtii]